MHHKYKKTTRKPATITMKSSYYTIEKMGEKIKSLVKNNFFTFLTIQTVSNFYNTVQFVISMKYVTI